MSPHDRSGLQSDSECAYTRLRESGQHVQLAFRCGVEIACRTLGPVDVRHERYLLTELEKKEKKKKKELVASN